MTGSRWDIRIKRAYEPAAADDGHRVLVDRLWPRGISHERLAGEWLKDVAPSTALREWFGHRPERWAGFVARYRAELEANPAPLEYLRGLAADGPLTLVYGARDERHNEAVVLRDWLLGRPAPA